MKRARFSRMTSITLAALIGLLLVSTSSQSSPQQRTIPPGGPTPAFNEITILLATSLQRPSVNADCEKLGAGCEKLVMKNLIDQTSGVVQPTLFLRGNRSVNQAGLATQELIMAVASGLGASAMFKGEFGVFVRTPSKAQTFTQAMSAAKAAADNLGRTDRRADVPRESVGVIQAVTKAGDFPAQVRIPVYYGFMTGGPDGKLGTSQDNVPVLAKEPQIMEATVNSVPPDPETCIKAHQWTLIDGSGPRRRWIKVECFRFLGLGDYQHKERPTYSPK